eukprot:3027469-Prymnesium_polylepis.1
MSADVEHLVRETHAERQCVVGWFREYEQVDVPDLAYMSLRTLRLLDRSSTDNAVEQRANWCASLAAERSPR